MDAQRKKIQHLYLRAGFGEMPARVRGKMKTDIHVLADELFREAEDIKPLDFLPKPNTNNNGKVGPLKILLMILRSQKEVERLNLAWMERMVKREGQLRERMTFFWHNHFATSVPFAWLMQVQNNTIRKHALGSFRKMLHAISKDPAMIIYLNNQQNRKAQPNENFAREVMELFTLGIGNYTEKDVKEAARAFTGWTVDGTGSFFFNEKQHDFEEKTVLGRTGKFNGEEIIDLLLEQKQTARFVCRKIYKEFVNQKPDEEIVAQLAKTFYESDYDIERLMRVIFSSDWFYAEKNMGGRIVSPVEMLVRYRRLVGLEFTEEKHQLQLQKVLGQTLFFPPNVAGWKGGRNWIDASSLLVRLSLPKAMLDGSGPELSAKPHFEEKEKEDPKKVKMTVRWKKLVDQLKDIPDDEIEDELFAALIQAPDKRIDRELVRSLINRSSREKRIVSTAVALMSLPEFQLV